MKTLAIIIISFSLLIPSISQAKIKLIHSSQKTIELSRFQLGRTSDNDQTIIIIGACGICPEQGFLITEKTKVIDANNKTTDGSSLIENIIYNASSISYQQKTNKVLVIRLVRK